MICILIQCIYILIQYIYILYGHSYNTILIIGYPYYTVLIILSLLYGGLFLYGILIPCDPYYTILYGILIPYYPYYRGYLIRHINTLPLSLPYLTPCIQYLHYFVLLRVYSIFTTLSYSVYIVSSALGYIILTPGIWYINPRCTIPTPPIYQEPMI